MKYSRIKQIRHLICPLIIILFTFFALPAYAGTVDVPLIHSLFKADCPVTVESDRISFEIDKRAKVLLKLPGVAEVHIDYEADGYFRLEYITATPSEYKIDPKFLIGYPLSKGKGSLKINFRHTLNWSPETYPLLMLEGTGTFTIRKLKAVTVSGLSDYRSEKNSAFFWRPENMRSNLMNFITPVYWNFSEKVLWTHILGAAFALSVLALFVFCYIYAKNPMKYLPWISAFFVLTFSLHYMVGFVQMVNGSFYLSSSEKIRKYFPVPELGQLVIAAKEKTRPGDKVGVISEKGAWFAGKAVCFYLTPIDCGAYDSSRNRYFGAVWFPRFRPSEINVIVSYNSDKSLSPDYATVYRLNKNVFIARRK